MNVYLDGAEKLKKKANEDTVKKNNPYLSLQTGASQLPAPVPSEPAPVNQKQVADNIGTVMSSGSAYEKVRKMQEDTYKAYNNLVNSQTAEGTTRLERQKKTISDSYNDAYKQLNVEKEANLRKLPEQMAKLGLYGSGSGETAVANITADYSNQLKSLMKAKNDAIYDIDGQIEAIKEQGAAQIAQYYSELMRSQPDLFLGMLDREFTNKQYADELEYRDKVFEYNKDNDLYSRNFTEKQYIDSKNESDYNKKLQEAQVAATYGNFDKLVELGLMNPDEAAFNANAYRYQNTPKVSGGGSGDKSSDELLKSQIDSNISHWLYSVKGLDGAEYMYNGWSDNTNPIYAAKDKINDADVISAIKKDLISAGYTAVQANSKIAEYKKNIANQIAAIEGKNKTTEDIMRRYGW